MGPVDTADCCSGEDSEAIERPTVTPAKQARAQGNRAAAGMSPVTPAEQARGQAEGDEDTDDEADREVRHCTDTVSSQI